MKIWKKRIELKDETVWELHDHYKADGKDYYEELFIEIGMAS